VVTVTLQPRFTPGEETPGTHWAGGLVALRASLDTEARGKKCFVLAGDRTPVVQSVDGHCSD
jgi:hypothetical protein